MYKLVGEVMVLSIILLCNPASAQMACNEPCEEIEIRGVSFRLMYETLRLQVGGANPGQPVAGATFEHQENVPANSQNINVDDDQGNPEFIATVIATGGAAAVAAQNVAKQPVGAPCPAECPCDSVLIRPPEPMADHFTDWIVKDGTRHRHRWKFRVKRERDRYRGSCSGQLPQEEEWEDSQLP